MTKKINIVNVLLIVAACFFLFNPNVIVIDFLPDFIGYILLCAALTRLADLDDRIADAVTGFKKMIFVDAGKFLAILWIFGMSVESEKTASMLLWTFVFCVLELIFAIPAYLNLFGGMLALANFYDNTAIHGYAKKKKRRNYTESIRLFTVIFVIVKAALAFLPEMAELSNTAYDESSAFLHIYRFIGLLRGMAFIAAFIVGVIWFFKMVRYFVRVKKDRELIDALTCAYEEKVVPKVGMFITRNMKTGIFLLATAAVFTLDIRFENINFLPDFIAGGILLGFVLYMNKRMFKIKKQMLVESVLYLLTSCAVAVMEFKFFTNHSFLSVLRNEEAAGDYWAFVVMTVIQSLIFIAWGILLVRNMKNIILEHTGNILGSSYNAEVEERQTSAFHRELSRPLIYVTAAFILYGICDVLTALRVYFYAYFEAEFGYLLTVNIIVGIAFIGVLLKVLWDIQEAIKIKYMLE